jgi:16S rRNA (guanine966-N2)-methyltransferase
VYLEAPRRWTDDELAPLGLVGFRYLKAGAVHAHLLRRSVDAAA